MYSRLRFDIVFAVRPLRPLSLYVPGCSLRSCLDLIFSMSIHSRRLVLLMMSIETPLISRAQTTNAKGTRKFCFIIVFCDLLSSVFRFCCAKRLMLCANLLQFDNKVSSLRRALQNPPQLVCKDRSLCVKDMCCCLLQFKYI